MRSVLAVVAGFAAWSALWLVGTVGVQTALASRIRPDQSTDDALVCSLLILLSVVCSMLAGWVTALVDQRRWFGASCAQALVLLAVGIAVEVATWKMLPAWYHVVFLILLVPATLAGARLRQRGGSTRSTAHAAV
jgi:hypothetical protein